MAVMKTKQKKQKKINLLSIDIGSHSIKVVAGIQQGDKLKVSGVCTKRLSAESYNNGAIVNAFDVKSAIQMAVSAVNSKSKDVVVTIESTEIIKREMVIALVDPEDRMSLITYEVGQYLPIDINAYVLQYKEIETFKEEGVDKMRILLGAMPKDMVKAHYDLIVSCGLNPVFMDMHSNSLEKIIMDPGKQTLNPAQRTTAYIDFGYNIIDISIVENGQYKFNRLLKLGGSELDKTLSNVLGITHEEAETLKLKPYTLSVYKEYSLDGDTNDLSTDINIANRTIKETIHYFNDCLEEIDKVFKYYTSRSVDNRIDAVVLYGGIIDFKGVSAYFKEKLDIPTEIIKSVSNVDFLCSLSQDELPKYINALGALIRR